MLSLHHLCYNIEIISIHISMAETLTATKHPSFTLVLFNFVERTFHCRSKRTRYRANWREREWANNSHWGHFSIQKRSAFKNFHIPFIRVFYVSFANYFPPKTFFVVVVIRFYPNLTNEPNRTLEEHVLYLKFRDTRFSIIYSHSLSLLFPCWFVILLLVKEKQIEAIH